MREQMQKEEAEEDKGGTPEVAELQSDGGTSNREKVNELVRQLVEKSEPGSSARKPL